MAGHDYDLGLRRDIERRAADWDRRRLQGLGRPLVDEEVLATQLGPIDDDIQETPTQEVATTELPPIVD